MTVLAVVGAGFMGGGIAAELALRLPDAEAVRVWDPQPGAAASAVHRAAGVAAALQGAGLLTQDGARAGLARLQAVPDLAAAVAGAAYVAEAAPERLDLKRDLFRRLDALAPPGAVLASNTSGYDPADLAAATDHPERVLVAHYFGPAYLIPLVEVVPHAGTAPWAADLTLSLLRRAGKRPVRLERYAPGFVANRLQQALFREALHLLREGIAPAGAIDEVVRASFGPRLAALGPFAVADFAGHDVYAALAGSVWPTLSTEPGAPDLPPELAASEATGRLGTKAGAGFYPWPEARLRHETARRDGALLTALRHLQAEAHPEDEHAESARARGPAPGAEQ